MARANEICGVYVIKNNIDGKVYIGSSKRIKTRLYLHKWELSKDNHHSVTLQRAVNKYGFDNFIFKPLLICSESDRLFYEQIIIDFYESYNSKKGYNISRFTDPSKLMKSWDEKTRKKSIEARKGKNYFEKGSINYLNLVAARKKGINHPMYGKTHTEEARLKISKSKKGKQAWNKGRESKFKGISRNIEIVNKIKISKRLKNPDWAKIEGKEIEIKQLYANGEKIYKLANMFNVKRNVIRIILAEK